MYTITKQGRYGFITPVPQGKLCNMLNKKMSYVKQGAEFMPNPAWATVKLYSVPKGRFPWGFRKLVVDIFREWKKFSSEYYCIDEFNVKPFTYPFVFNDNQLREYQKAAVKALLQNEGGILCLPTGAGKTRTAIEYIKQLNVATLVVVHTTTLRTQWQEVLVNNGIASLVAVATYQSLKQLSILRNFGLVIFDECHHVAAKNLYKVAMNCPEAILVGLSATPRREDGEDMRIEAALGKIVYSITRKELIDQGYLVNANVFYHPIAPAMDNFFTNYQEAYEVYIVNNLERNKKIISLAIEEYAKGKTILILCSYIQHMENLKTMLDNNSLDIFNYVFIHGKIKKKDQQIISEKITNSTEGLIIFASTIYDEGMDFPNLDCVILAAGGKSSIKLTQRVGRILRPQPNKPTAIIHDFKDNCKWMSLHSKRRHEILSVDFEVQGW